VRQSRFPDPDRFVPPSVRRYSRLLSIYSLHQDNPQERKPEDLSGRLNIIWLFTAMSWNNPLFDCCSPLGTCCLATWCPCVLYGKTSARLDKPSKDSPSGCNASCCGWCILSTCYLSSFLQCMSRGKIRSRYNLEGSVCTDCLASFCCTCCDLVQQDKEVKNQQHLAPAGYEKPPKMTYTQPA